MGKCCWSPEPRSHGHGGLSPQSMNSNRAPGAGGCRHLPDGEAGALWGEEVALERCHSSTVTENCFFWKNVVPFNPHLKLTTELFFHFREKWSQGIFESWKGWK